MLLAEDFWQTHRMRVLQWKFPSPLRRRGLRPLWAGATLVGLIALLSYPTYFLGSDAVPLREADSAQGVVVMANDRPSSSAFDPVATFAATRLPEMSLEQKIRSLLMLHLPGTDVATLQGFMSSTGAGGFILMGSNVPESPEAMAVLSEALTLDPALPALVAIDEEGGVVTRLPYDNYAGADTLRAEEPAATLAAFTARAALLASVGVNVNFGIVADVTSDPQSFIYDRTFGDTPASAAARVAAAVAGEKSVVASTLKHFPGHGSARGDSHVSIPATTLAESEWHLGEGVPFVAGLDAGASLVMFGHLAYTAVDSAPASLSRAWHSILREELGFDGVTVTDDMTMLQGSGRAEFSDPVENAVRALEAGNDILLYVLAADPSLDGVDPEAIVAGLVDAVNTGRLTETQLDESALRVLTLRRSFAKDALSWLPPCPAPCRAFVDVHPTTTG
jgi:beta-N-acetylhexosaminidase